MSNYLIKRMLSLVPQFIGITLISFIVIHLAPGGPMDTQSWLNPKISREAKEKVEKLYGLDRPLPIQYVHWAKRLLTFDFGNSFVDGQKVTNKVCDAAPVTLLINLLSLFFIL